MIYNNLTSGHSRMRTRSWSTGSGQSRTSPSICCYCLRLLVLVLLLLLLLLLLLWLLLSLSLLLLRLLLLRVTVAIAITITLTITLPLTSPASLLPGSLVASPDGLPVQPLGHRAIRPDLAVGRPADAVSTLVFSRRASFQGLQRYGWHRSTNRFEILRGISDLAVSAGRSRARASRDVPAHGFADS